MNRYSQMVSGQRESYRLKEYLKLMLPGISSGAISNALRQRDILINGERVRDDVVLHSGDMLDVFTSFERKLPQVVFVDDNILIVNKPAELSSVSVLKDEFSVATWAQSQYPNEDVRVCHRLDYLTGGLLILARTRAVHEQVIAAFRNHWVNKEYVCLVVGSPYPLKRTCDAYLVKNAKTARVIVYPDERRGAKPIRTTYEVVKAGAVSRVKVTPHTGRTHQIRAHMAYLGFPLLGDDQYGNREANKGYKARCLNLSATKLSFQCEGTLSYLNEKAFSLEAPF